MTEILPNEQAVSGKTVAGLGSTPGQRLVTLPRLIMVEPCAVPSLSAEAAVAVPDVITVEAAATPIGCSTPSNSTAGTSQVREASAEGRERCQAALDRSAASQLLQSAHLTIACGAARGATAAAAAYAAALCATGCSHTSEDLVDLGHSLYTAIVALVTYTTARWRRLLSGSVSAGKELEGSEKEVLVFDKFWAERLGVSMYQHSLGYFWADIALLLVSLALGRRPQLWEGRLVHHALQTVANVTCLLPGPGYRARCCYMGVGYIAEVSSVPLRLMSLARRMNASTKVVCLLHDTTLASFAASRISNGLYCFYIIWAARWQVVWPLIKAHMFFGFCAYALNMVWFFKLLHGRKKLRSISVR